MSATARLLVKTDDGWRRCGDIVEFSEPNEAVLGDVRLRVTYRGYESAIPLPGKRWGIYYGRLLGVDVFRAVVIRVKPLAGELGMDICLRVQGPVEQISTPHRRRETPLHA